MFTLLSAAVLFNILIKANFWKDVTCPRFPEGEVKKLGCGDARNFVGFFGLWTFTVLPSSGYQF